MAGRMTPPVRRRWQPTAIRLAILTIALVFLMLRNRGPQEQVDVPIGDSLPAAEQTVLRVVDGDTLVLSEANNERVRLLGVDTPGSVKPDHPVEPWGLEASQFTKQAVEGRRVRLEFDKERQDKYGRWLAYVWYVDESNEEKLLNEEILRAGLGRFLPQFPYSDAMKRRFRAAEQEARDAGRGLWQAARRAA